MLLAECAAAHVDIRVGHRVTDLSLSAEDAARAMTAQTAIYRRWQSFCGFTLT